MHRHVGIGGVALAAALAFGTGGAAGALADEPLPDPTNPPVYTPSPGTVPATTLPAPATTSAKLQLLSGRRLVLDPRRLRTTVEVRCGYATTGRCDATGQLFVTVGRQAHADRLVAGPDPRPAGLRPVVSPDQGGPESAPRPRAARNAATAPTASRARRGRHPSAPPSRRSSTCRSRSCRCRPRRRPGRPSPPARRSGVTLPALTGGGGPPTATVAGIVNPRGEHTTFHFEYGPAKGAYLSLAPSVDKPVNSDDHFEHVVSATLTGLESPSTVHYRLVATNADGTTFGADQQFSVPFVFPAPGGAPTLDATAAGPVSLIVTNNFCVPSLGVTLAGQDLTCTVSVFNPQPPVVGIGAGTTVVRPANEVLAIHAPSGMIGSTTHSPIEPLPVFVPPQTTVNGTVKFSVLQAPLFGTPEVAEQIGAAPSMATMPSAGRPNLHLNISCKPPGTFLAGAELDCTITIQNTGADTADITSFELHPSSVLNPDGDFTDGDPPLVLRGILTGGGGDPVTIKARLKTNKTAAVGSGASVQVTVAGFDDTDRNPFNLSDTSSTSPVVARG